MEKIANELKRAGDHNITPQAKMHIKRAEKIATKFVLDDMKAARKCQRNNIKLAKKIIRKGD